MGITIKDVAQRAGVGTGTVSRVIAGSELVRPGTRARVEAAAVELGYRLERTRHGRHATRQRLIVVIVAQQAREAFAERLRGMLLELADAPHRLMIRLIRTTRQCTEAVEQALQAGRADGIVLVSCPLEPEHLERLSASPIPVAVIEAPHVVSVRVSRVRVDEEEAMFRAVEHLLDLRHRRIGYLGELAAGLPATLVSSARLVGYRHALKARRLSVTAEHMAFCDPTRTAARVAATRILLQPHRPTAFVAANDSQALGILEAAKALHIAVPQELSVIGLGDARDARLANLTTISRRLEETGRQAIRVVLDRIAEPGLTAADVNLQPILIARRTTGPAALAD